MTAQKGTGMRDLQPIIEKAKQVIASHKLETGAYARWIWPDASGRRLGLNED